MDGQEERRLSLSSSEDDHDDGVALMRSGGGNSVGPVLGNNNSVHPSHVDVETKTDGQHVVDGAPSTFVDPQMASGSGTASGGAVVTERRRTCGNTDSGDVEDGYCEATCRICLGDTEDGRLFSPCLCKGTMKYVHVECLQRWRVESKGKPSYFRCDQCHYRYNLARVQAHGILGHPFVIPFLTVLIFVGALATSTACMSLFCSEKFLTGLFVEGHTKLNTVILAVLVLGLIAFVASMFVEGCEGEGCDMMSGLHAAGCPCDLVALNAGECIAFIMVIVILVVVLVGLSRALRFMHTKLRMVATGTVHAIDSMVLEPHAAAGRRPLSPQPLTSTFAVDDIDDEGTDLI